MRATKHVCSNGLNKEGMRTLSGKALDYLDNDHTW